MQATLGIDVSKHKLDCCLKISNKYLHRQFSNNAQGFAKISQWLAKYQTNVHACLEATGNYGEAVADYLNEAGHKVSVVNPLSIKKYIEMQLLAVKTDKQDAQSIADYCQSQNPPAYIFPSQSERKLKALTRQLDYLTDMATAQKNRLQVSHPATTDYIKQMLAHIENQIKQIEADIKQHIKSNNELQSKAKLLQSVKGIGARTIPYLLTLFAERSFQNAKQMISYLGLNPIIKQSGKSKARYAAISKQGNKHVRTALYMPAVACFRLPEYKVFIQRLQQAGKHNKQIICALMRKLAVYCYTVIKNKTMFTQSQNTQSSLG